MSKAPLASSNWQIVEVATDKLLLDPHNPRLTDFGLDASATQAEIISVLWTHMAVDEVALSISENGFYRHEALYAANEGNKLYVVEGNRRLAAVKLLRDDALRSKLKITSLPTLSAAKKRQLDTLPVVYCKRDEIWAYLGFKHINGPQAWESYPKAHYVAWVHNEIGIPLDEIARKIGDKHSTVERLYDALMVLDQAEDVGVFDRDDRYRDHFSFSHLTTGLGYSGIQSFLGLPKGDGRTIGKRKPVPKSNVKHLGELLVWMYGSKSRSLQPLVQSQNPDLRMAKLPDDSLLYLDPPYYAKGKALYHDFYDHDDHERLSKFMKSLDGSQKFIISYDNCAAIRSFYRGLPGFTYKIGYNARDVRLGTEVMFFSRDLMIPPIERPMSACRALRRTAK